VQFQRQLGLSRYETAFALLHKLRAGMVRPDQDRIGGASVEHVEVDETLVGGRTRGEGRGVHHMVVVVAAVDIRQRKPGTKLDERKGGRYAGRVRLSIVPDRSAKSLCGFVKKAVEPKTLVVTDDWKGYAGLEKSGYRHFAATQLGDASVTEECLPIIHLVFANLKSWLLGTPSWCQPSASTGLLERIHLPFQQTLLSVQRLSLAARDRRCRNCSDL